MLKKRNFIPYAHKAPRENLQLQNYDFDQAFLKKNLKINYGFNKFSNKIQSRPKKTNSISYFQFSKQMRDTFGGDGD